MAPMASISGNWPYRLIGMIARVRFVMRAAIKLASILPVCGSTSTNTGLAPSNAITSALAAKVNGLVMTSSPGPIPRAIKEINNASVPLATVMQCFTSTKLASACSSSATSGPMMYCPCASTAAILRSSSGLIACCCVFRSMNCISDLFEDSCRRTADDTVTLRKAAVDHRACRHHGSIAQHHAGENHRIHADPALLADHDILTVLVFIQRIQTMIRRDDADVRCDIGPAPEVDGALEVLQVDAGRLEIVDVVWMEHQVVRVGYIASQAARPRQRTRQAQDVLLPD